jgi:hypothetical protein
MKYLQQFESYRDFYHEIPAVTLMAAGRTIISPAGRVYLPESDLKSFLPSEFNQIKNQVHQVQSSWETSMNKDNSEILVKLVGVKRSFVIKEKTRLIYQITKIEDEWFYVKGFDILDESKVIRDRYFKCDQLEGVLKLISDLGSNRFFVDC